MRRVCCYRRRRKCRRHKARCPCQFCPRGLAGLYPNGSRGGRANCSNFNIAPRSTPTIFHHEAQEEHEESSKPVEIRWYYQSGSRFFVLFVSFVAWKTIKRTHFAGGDLTPPLTNGDARPLWKPHNFVPASRGGVNIEFTRSLDVLKQSTHAMGQEELV